MQVNFPNSWQRIPLGKAFKTITGNTPSKKETSNYGHDIPFIKPPNICNRPISDFQEMLSKKGAVNGRIAPKDSILITCIGNLGRVGITTKNVGFNQQINAILPNYELAHPKFIYFQAQWQHFKRQLESYSSATTVTIVNKGNFDKIQILLPPLPEQHRIVAKLEELFSELDNGIANLKKAQAQLKVYRQAVLKAAFEGKLTEQWRAASPEATPDAADKLLDQIKAERQRHSKKPKEYPPLTEAELKELPALPVGWKWVRLGNLSEIVGGVTKGRNLEGQSTIELPYLRVANVQDGYLDLGVIKTIQVLPTDLSKYRLLEGDILYTEGGDKDKLGRGSVWKGEIPDCIHQNHVFRARLYHKGMVPSLIAYYSQTKIARNYFFRNAKQTVNLASINMTVLSNLPVTVCSGAEQGKILEEIESRLSVCDHLEQEIEKALRKSEALRQSILKKAFEGRLVPQDPGDEPAGELLKRIKQKVNTLL